MLQEKSQEQKADTNRFPDWEPPAITVLSGAETEGKSTYRSEYTVVNAYGPS